MPKKDGLELILEIKAQCPDVKVFAMTGDFVTKDDVGNVEAADAFGAEYVFKKPITPSEVHKKLIELKA
jgi:CheY-like chemotaxis protein